MIAQFGVAGFALFPALLATQWRGGRAWRPARPQAAARGFVITMVVTSLFSSTLLDHSEGFFFAYMGGLLFAGYRAQAPADARPRAR